MRHCTHGIAPTFSFDLHVLGAPPALILSRDQTLEVTDRPPGKNRSLTVAARKPARLTCRGCSPGETQLDEIYDVFASNQIVKDLRPAGSSPATTPESPDRTGLEAFGADARKGTSTPESRNLKDRSGRLYPSRPGRDFVTVPSKPPTHKPCGNRVASGSVAGGPGKSKRSHKRKR